MHVRFLSLMSESYLKIYLDFFGYFSVHKEVEKDYIDLIANGNRGYIGKQ